MTRVRVDVDALTEWSRALDRLPPLVGQSGPVGSTSAVAGSSEAATLHRASVAGLLALAEVMESFDRLTEQLRAAAVTAAAEYSLVDGHAASIVDAGVR